MNMKTFGIALIAVGMLIFAANEAAGQSFKMTVVDWSGRARGQEQNPAWLRPLVHGNAKEARATFGIASGDSVKWSVA